MAERELFLWNEMLKKSFVPNEWEFVKDDDEDKAESAVMDIDPFMIDPVIARLIASPLC